MLKIILRILGCIFAYLSLSLIIILLISIIINIDWEWIFRSALKTLTVFNIIFLIVVISFKVPVESASMGAFMERSMNIIIGSSTVFYFFSALLLGQK